MGQMGEERGDYRSGQRVGINYVPMRYRMEHCETKMNKGRREGKKTFEHG